MSDMSIDYLLAKATAGERLYFDEALQLFRNAELEQLGAAASTIRARRVPGEIVTYLVDYHIRFTNVCVTGCSFCESHRPPGHPECYVYTREELAEKIAVLTGMGGTRVLLRGGHHPDLALDWYVDLLRWMSNAYPDLERECFSPPEIAHMANLSKLPLRDVLRELQAAGLQGVPGDEADILDDSLRAQVAPRKQHSDGWLTVMREAQKLMLNTTASMMIGLGETLEQRMHHLQRLRSLQDYSLREFGQGFSAFMAWKLPASSQHSNGNGNGHGTASAPNTDAAVQDYLRTVALARLYLDNIPHHQAHWLSQGTSVSQQALAYGLDDFGSTMFTKDVLPVAAHQTASHIGEGDIHALVREAGYTPARRDTAYNLLRVFEHPDESPAPTMRAVGNSPIETIPLTQRQN